MSRNVEQKRELIDQIHQMSDRLEELRLESFNAISKEDEDKIDDEIDYLENELWIYKEELENL